MGKGKDLTMPLDFDTLGYDMISIRFAIQYV